MKLTVLTQTCLLYSVILLKPAGHDSSLLRQIPRNAVKLLHGFLEAALKPATCAGIPFVEVKAVSLVRELAASLLRGQAGHAKRPFASACVTLTACFDMFPIIPLYLEGQSWCQWRHGWLTLERSGQVPVGAGCGCFSTTGTRRAGQGTGGNHRGW